MELAKLLSTFVLEQKYLWSKICSYSSNLLIYHETCFSFISNSKVWEDTRIFISLGIGEEHSHVEIYSFCCLSADYARWRSFDTVTGPFEMSTNVFLWSWNFNLVDISHSYRTKLFFLGHGNVDLQIGIFLVWV